MENKKIVIIRALPLEVHESEIGGAIEELPLLPGNIISYRNFLNKFLYEVIGESWGLVIEVPKDSPIWFVASLLKEANTYPYKWVGVCEEGENLSVAVQTATAEINEGDYIPLVNREIVRYTISL
ncbi:MAG: hypothetical protein N2505_06520 [Endomicrobia bacterium]|nr:hypothetical protein [Endomicrobiia bacterium]